MEKRGPPFLPWQRRAATSSIFSPYPCLFLASSFTINRFSFPTWFPTLSLVSYSLSTEIFFSCHLFHYFTFWPFNLIFYSMSPSPKHLMIFSLSTPTPYHLPGFPLTILIGCPSKFWLPLTKQQGKPGREAKTWKGSLSDRVFLRDLRRVRKPV